MLDKYDHLLHGVATVDEACDMGTKLLEKHLDYVEICTVCENEVDEFLRDITIANCVRALAILENRRF